MIEEMVWMIWVIVVIPFLVEALNLILVMPFLEQDLRLEQEQELGQMMELELELEWVLERRPRQEGVEEEGTLFVDLL